MLSMVWWNGCSLEEEANEITGTANQSPRASFVGMDNKAGSPDQKAGSMAVGLRILVQQLSKAGEGGGVDSNVVVKKSSPSLLTASCCLFHTSTVPSSGSCHDDDYYSCFLKSCFLCHKNLSLDKEVYMYKGDQGFCSVECRDRQIYIDEMREIEAYSKKILASFRQSRASRCDTNRCLFSRPRGRTIFS